MGGLRSGWPNCLLCASNFSFSVMLLKIGLANIKCQSDSEAHRFLQKLIRRCLQSVNSDHLLKIFLFLPYIPAPSTRACASSTFDVCNGSSHPGPRRFPDH